MKTEYFESVSKNTCFKFDRVCDERWVACASARMPKYVLFYVKK